MNFYSVVSTDECYRCSCNATADLLLTQLFVQIDIYNNAIWACKDYHMCKDCFLFIRYDNNWSLVPKKFLEKMKKKNEVISRI